MNIADGYQAIMNAAARAMQPDPVLYLDQWAEENIILRPPAALAGPYRLAHTPMARRVLQCLSPHHPATRVVVRAASQMLKTQVFICAALGWIHRTPANILALEPTDKLAKRLSTRVADAIDSCAAVSAVVAKPRSRDARNTIDCKEFHGGAIYITTAGSAANLAEIPARYVFCDEIDRMDNNVNGEGDPIDLAEARTTTFQGLQKIYLVSSPTVQDASKIDANFERGTQEHYHVPCPHCTEPHQLVAEHFKYSRDDTTGNVTRAWFNCPHCGAEIDESSKAAMLRDEVAGGTARWVATGPGDGETVSFHLSAFYAPPGSITWLSLARQLARAEEAVEIGNLEPMRVYQNTRLAKSFAYQSNQPAAADLRTRAADYAELTVPPGGLILTAGVDVQHDRLAIVIRAWGRGEESWLVYWGEIHGTTTNPAAGAWEDLGNLLDRQIPHANGGTLRVAAVSVDGSDGSRTEIVHAFVRPRRHRNYMTVKGASEQTSDRREIFTPPKTIDIGKRQKLAKFGLQTHIVGTARAKDLILETRIHLLGQGPGRVHWYATVRADYWDQLTSEVKAPTGPSRRLAWVKKGGQRNEGLDCEVYALHAARSIKTNLMRDAHWAAIDQQLRQRSLLDGPACEPTTQANGVVPMNSKAPDSEHDQSQPADDQPKSERTTAQAQAVQAPAAPLPRQVHPRVLRNNAFSINNW